jgi:quercetin dioxygenase-like cupin family protein
MTWTNPSDDKETQMRITNAKEIDRGGIVQSGRRTGVNRIKSFTLLQVACAVMLAVLIACATVLATPSFGINQVIVGSAVYDDIDIHARRHHWRASLKVKGTSDVFVNKNDAIPGATSGWHSHPGLSVVSVTQGAVTLYDGDDPACTPIIVTAGHGFVEPGDHVHILRNEGFVNAEWITTAIRPAGSAGRMDQPNPGNCPF